MGLLMIEGPWTLKPLSVLRATFTCIDLTKQKSLVQANEIFCRLSKFR